MCWVGAKEPGGAFQGGTILAAMWLLVIIARPGERTFDRAALVAPCGSSSDRSSSLPSDLPGSCWPMPFLLIHAGYAKPLIVAVEVALTISIAAALAHAGRRPAGTGATAMNGATLFGLCGSALVGIGLYGLITNPEPLRKILAFNLLGSGVFLLFGVIARRAAAAGFPGDPVPQAMVITAIVVAFAATAMAIALVLRLLEETGRATLSSDNPGSTVADRGNP